MLTITSDQWSVICGHLTAGLPNEACGLLAGKAGQVDKVYLVTNARPGPTHYDMEPAELHAAILEMDDKGWELLGIFHSHPVGPEIPSPTDVAQAYYPDSAYLIFTPLPESDTDKKWQASAFEIRQGMARAIPLEVK
jgi:[CysO sulfur-carrier protein]-S-L-cysteine hydrolase